MDDRVIRAMARWPNVPAVFGWVGLDCRGRWRLDGGLVRNRTTAHAISRNYACDQEGRAYYQNGPQRAYVNLEYTPWVYVLDGDGRLCTHTGVELKSLTGVWLDDESNLLFESEYGIGVVSDVDLDALSGQFCDADGQNIDDDTLEAVLEASSDDLLIGIFLHHEGQLLPVARIKREHVAARFGFVPTPSDGDNETSSSSRED